MPISLNSPKSFVLDKVQITKFEVTPSFGHVVIHFSKGYETETGEFVAKEFDRVDYKGVEFEESLYDSVKKKLYELLDSSVNATKPAPEPTPNPVPKV
jgi:hypothetical protein